MTSGAETAISPVATQRPDLTGPIEAINEQPVELDSTPTSPEKMRRTSRARTLERIELQLSPAEQERLQKLAESRKDDPAVMQDIEQMPTAEELEMAEEKTNDVFAGDQSVTTT